MMYKVTRRKNGPKLITEDLITANEANIMEHILQTGKLN